VTWVINPAVDCHYFPPALQLSPQLLRGCYQCRCLVNRGTMGVNSFPKTVTRQRRGCNLNPGPSAPESSTLTTRLQSHPLNKWRRLTSSQLHLYSATDRRTRNIVMSVSVCPRSYLRNDISDLHEIFCPCYLWPLLGPRRRNDTLCISGFVDDVIFAHKLIGCSTSPPGWGSHVRSRRLIA